MIDYPVITGFLKIIFPGITIILKDQNAQAPALPYIAWKEIVNVSKSRPEETYVDRFFNDPLLTLGGDEIKALDGQNIEVIRKEYTEKLTQNKVSTIQVDAFTETISQAVIKEIQNHVSAGNLLDAGIIRTSTFTAQKYQRDNDIGVMDWIDPSRFAQFMGDNSEERAMMEFKLNNTEVYEEDSNAIDTDTININLTLEGLQ